MNDSNSDSDSSVEKVLGKDYSFLRNTLFAKVSDASSSKLAVEDSKKTVFDTVEPTVVVPDSVTIVDDSLTSRLQSVETVSEDSLMEITNLPSQRYKNLSFEELNTIAQRVKIYHEVGVVVPDKAVPCKNKRKTNTRQPQKPQKSSKKRKSTFGTGNIGSSCASFGVRRCLCCNIQNEDNFNGRIGAGFNFPFGAGFPMDDIDRYVSVFSEEPFYEGDDEWEVWPQTSSQVTNASTIGDKTNNNQNSTTPHNTFLTSTPIQSKPTRRQSFNCGEVSPVKEQLIEIDDSTPKVAQSTNGTKDPKKDEQLMDYVNDLLGSTADTIIEEVEERFQRLNDNRRVATDAISNAISSNHDDVHDQLDLDHSVEIVSVSSPQPICVDDITVTNNESDVLIVEQKPYTPVSKNTRKRGKMSIPPVEAKKQCQSVIDVENVEENKKEEGPKRECPICLEALVNTEISATICGHVFCTKCIKEAIKQKKMCPNCRKRLTLKQVHPLYL